MNNFFSKNISLNFLKLNLTLFGKLTFLAIFAISPLLSPGWIDMGETKDQLIRLIELDRGILEGDPYPRWFGDLAGGFGIPYFVYYAPLVYYVAEFFLFLGFSQIMAMKCMIILGVVLSGFGTYLFTKRFWGEAGAMISAVAYMYVPYRMLNIYGRGDLAEAFAMSLLPFVVEAFYALTVNKRPRDLVFSAVIYGALITTHNCTALIFSTFLFCFIVFISIQEKSLRSFLLALLAVFLAYTLSAFFWIPALYEKQFVNIHMIYTNPALNYSNNFLNITDLFSDRWTLDGGIGGRNFSFQIGTPHILLAFFTLILFSKRNILFKKNNKLRYTVNFLAVSILFFIFLMLKQSIFIWNILPLVKYLQFPFRLLTIVAFLVSLLCGGVILYTESSKTGQAIKIITIIIIIAWCGRHISAKGYCYVNVETIFTQDFVTKDGGTISAWNTQQMDKIYDFGEYLPKTVKSLPDKNLAGRILVSGGEATIQDVNRGMQGYSFEVDAAKNTKLVLGSFYYPSWKATVDGKMWELATNEFGLIEIAIPEGAHHVCVFFGDSFVRKISCYISLAALVVLLILYVYNILYAYNIVTNRKRS